MAYKYRGKLTKCRKCKHADHIGMVLVFVKDTCLNPDVAQLTDCRVIDKQGCQACEVFEPKEAANA